MSTYQKDIPLVISKRLRRELLLYRFEQGKSLVISGVMGYWDRVGRHDGFLTITKDFGVAEERCASRDVYQVLSFVPMVGMVESKGRSRRVFGISASRSTGTRGSPTIHDQTEG
jgi:hypothetical protein